jgi:hypothetical protein
MPQITISFKEEELKAVEMAAERANLCRHAFVRKAILDSLQDSFPY